ncbi:MAG: type II toxin-antitoxin system PemK/MazF family toxin [Polyangiaceae bacterium]|nr:type II toxin-antitoxin system PemK/MazF family toxin [Polyangiaceae bacterium]
MARRIARGEIWLYGFRPPDKRRPVLVLSRDDALAVLRTATVAPITSTIRDLPSEVVLGVEDGMKGACAVNLDHVQTVRTDDLHRRVATLDPGKLALVCQALAVAFGCR